MKLIITIAIIALIAREVISLLRDNKRQKQSVEMSREVKRIRNEWSGAEVTIRESTRRQEEIEREMRRQEREAERERFRQAQVIERIEREQEKQAAQLAKQQEQMAKFEFRLSEAERTIEHYKPLYDTLKRQYDELIAKVNSYEREMSEAPTLQTLRKSSAPMKAAYALKGENLKGGYENAKKELVKVGNQLFTIETKLRKAEFNRDEAERKLSA